MGKLFITDPKQLLLAVAQVIEDHPEIHTIEVAARNKNGFWEEAESNNACKFCAMGMMRRLVAEGTTNNTTTNKATKMFKISTGTWISVANDDKSRGTFVGMLRKAAS